MDRGFVIKNNDLLFEIYFSATPRTMTITTAPRLCTQLCSLTFFNYIPDYCGFPWAMKSQFLEKTTIGKHWEELFTQLDQDLPVAWSELADAKDLYTVVEHVHSWTTKDIHIQGLPPRPGNWTTQEE